MKLIPIEQLIELPDGIAIQPELLQLASLSTLVERVTLLTMVGSTNVSINRKGRELNVKMVRVIRDEEPLAQKFGTKTVAQAMDAATGMVPVDEQKAARLPVVTFASWKLPNEVCWEFSMSQSTTGVQLLDVVQASETFVMETTEQLLTESMPTN